MLDEGSGVQGENEGALWVQECAYIVLSSDVDHVLVGRNFCPP